MLLTQTADGQTTHYTQDLAAPLSQVLQIRQPDQTTDVLYGLERLGTVSRGSTTWTGGDALGSTRLTLDDAGAVVGTTSYDAWGVPQAALRAPFGFTGEIHSQGLVYLRARWYDPTSGTFLTRDPFAGFPRQPYSLHPYQYGYSNPLRYTDPSGECVGSVWHVLSYPVLLIL